MKIKIRNIEFIGSSLDDLSAMPIKIKANFGHSLWEAQRGEYPVLAKPLSDFGNANVIIELKANSSDGTYRAVYTVPFADAIYVLHCFKKKSTSGISTPKPDIELIKKRLKIAIETDRMKRGNCNG